ncbi:MAG: PCRF domain-containing protein [Pirellulaceae bacterium]
MSSIRDTLEQKLKRFNDLERQMSDPEVQADGSRMSAVARGTADWREWRTSTAPSKKLTDEIRGCKQIIEETDDPDEREMAEEKPNSLRKRRESFGMNCWR